MDMLATTDRNSQQVVPKLDIHKNRAEETRRELLPDHADPER